MTLHGAGASSCRDFAEILDAFRPFLDGTAHDVVAQRTTANYLQYEEWLEGYIFGIETNIRGAGVLHDWDQVGMGECRERGACLLRNAEQLA